LALEGPSKANHVLRYLRRLFRWGMQRGHCTDNPAAGVQQAAERKRRRLPDPAVMAALAQFAQERGALPARSKGACPSYLWAVLELAYLCRLRGIEVITLTDAHALADGVATNRRKGSRDNVVRWTPRLRAAWDALKARRARLWAERSTQIPIRAELRPLVVSEDGAALKKSSLDTAWQRLIASAIDAGKLDAADRFSLHDLKRRGITDTPGTRADKQEASGHRSAAMLDVYDLSVPLVDPSKS
jgi:site-specific recombinase XerD